MKSIVKVKLISVITVHLNIPHWSLVKEMSPALKTKTKTLTTGKGGIATSEFKNKGSRDAYKEQRTTEQFEMIQ